MGVKGFLPFKTFTTFFAASIAIAVLASIVALPICGAKTTFFNFNNSGCILGSFS